MGPYHACVMGRVMGNTLRSAGIPHALLAHQGGWDEILLVVGPMAVVAGLLWLAKRRLTRAERAQSESSRRTSDDLSPSA
jgi:cyanate permease